MKEKIQFLSKGVFEYANPDIEVSEQSILLEVACGGRFAGSLELKSRNHIAIRAMIFSSDKWMQCQEKMLVGERCVLHYVFDTQALEIGETVEGCISIISNGGELTIPYRVQIQAPCKETSMGPMSDLDQFAALARENWAEALAIFRSADFRKIFLSHRKYQRMYDALIRGNDQALAMEEFLCTIKRKEPVRISVSQDMIEYCGVEKTVSERLLIEKSVWGRVRINVRTEGNFLTVYKQRITDEDFLGSYYQLEYEVRPNKGQSAQGKIILETFQQRIEIPVFCRQEKSRREERISSRALKQSWLHFNRNYLELQLGRISRETWLTLARENIDGCMNHSNNPVYRVVEADYLVMAGDVRGAREILEAMNGRELRYRSTLTYCYYLYVSARCRSDEHYTEFVRDTIRFYADGQCKERWEPQYMLLQLDDRKERHQAQIFRKIRELHEQGLPGSLLYLEAARIVNKDPSIIREMDNFSVDLFLWGVRHDYLNREVIFRFADLAVKMRRSNGQCMHVLMEMCDLYETENLLRAVLHLLMLGGRKEKSFHRWYALGIRSAIKMPDLYEYYMASLDMSECVELPTSVLIYFQYDNKLDSDKKAFLYRYIIEHREQHEKLMENYDSIIQAFASAQLQSGRIDENLAVIYRYYLTGDKLTPHVMQALPAVMFKQRVHCMQEGIKAVIVDYAELEQELVYPVTDGYAYVDIFMDDYRLLFVDEAGGRHMAAMDCEMTELMDASKYIRECYEYCNDDPMVVLNRSERALKYQMIDDTSIQTYKWALRLKNVSRNYQKIILNNLIDYYYDNYEGETLEKYLLQIDIRLLGHRERAHIIEYFIQRGLFDKAYVSILIYGSHGIQDKRIMRLCSRIIREKQFEEDEVLVDLAYQAFEGGKYDETVLQYLIRYYMGPTRNLLMIWQAAKDFEVLATALEERLLCMMLFTEKLVKEGCRVLDSYYESHSGQRLVKAFLAYYAYHYLRDELGADAQVFRLMEIELDQMEEARDACGLALLKYDAQLAHIPTEYVGRLRQEVARFMDMGIVLPFFKKFMGSAETPEELLDCTFIEHHGRAGMTAEIYYRQSESNDREFKRQPMKQVFLGIFMSTFRLYAGERLDYYIVENDADGEHRLPMQTVTASNGGNASLEDGANQLNRMMEYLNFHDDLALDKALLDYHRMDQLTERLFTIKTVNGD